MNRLPKIKKQLGKDFDAILISSIPNIVYLTGFAGFSKDEREAYLLINKKNNYVFTDGRYLEVAKSFRGFKLVEISALKKFGQVFKEIIAKEKVKKIAIDVNDLKVSEFKKIRKFVRTVPDENLIEDLRSIKDKNEIILIKKACKLGDKVFKHILSELKSGVSEIEIAKKIEIFILNSGAEIAFKPIVAFGANSSSPHHVSRKRKLKKNQIVLLDFGVKLNNYCSDMTRTVFFGKANVKQKQIYQTALGAQTKAIEFLKSSVVNDQWKILGSEVDSVARSYIESQGFPSIPHSLGHGIGLEVHEKPRLAPKSKDILEPGMLFSVEPGIYIPSYGGVRIEDLVLLTKNGPEIITHANRELIEL